ncbi:whey acidic protein-like isoform X4 [Pomacea canaliculata]|uniref:whey acidic protein-like isoform X4 n=1 Tax=Pomacea canaliculata TaxID=400727 RepID=UPI000D736B3B|nr:whey acidic protein-like isoform X4 [Pomacea canaliculata]
MESSVGAQVVSTSLLLVLALLSFGASQGVEPLCQSKVCAATEECRVSEQCDASQKCTFSPVCIPKQTSTFLSGGCIIGEPLIRQAGNEWETVVCHPRAPCPTDFYCSVALMDVAARCCRSDTVRPPKPGVCPNPDPSVERFFCVDTCLTDNDCFYNEKCCNTGCAKQCTNPIEDPCRAKVCPNGGMCQLSSLGQPECVPVGLRS